MTAAEISRLLAQRIETLAPELLPGGHRENHEWRCGSIAGEPGDSLGVHLTGEKAGVWADFASDERGDALDLICAVQHRDKREAIAWARGWLGIGDDPPGRSRIVAKYDYVDEVGALLFQVCRREPKKFFQRAPDGKGGWKRDEDGKLTMKGTRLVPYHLDHIIAAKSQANGSAPRIYVTEGEKDALRLAQWGLTATTNPGGAGKWRPEFNQYFAGCDVVIIPDNDDVGRKHAQAVAADLARIAASVRIVELRPLPEGGDVSDWINGGASESDLDTFVETIEPLNELLNPDLSSIIHDAGDIDVTKIPPREWLLGVTFCRTFLSGLIGDGGVGKTAIRYAQYLAGATGRNDITGEYVHHRFRTLIVCLEDDLDEVSRRIGAAMLHHKVSQTDVKGWLYYCTPQGLKLLQEGLRGERVTGPLYEELKTWIKAKKIDVVGIDPFIKAHGVGESDNNAIDEVCTMLAGIAHEFKCAIDLVSHARKGAGEPGDAERERGASAKKDAGRLMRTVTAMSDDEAKLFNAPEDERPSLVRVDDAKVNITKKSHKATWFKLIGINIPNSTAAYPNGDEVQTIECWKPPDTFATLKSSTINQILERIEAGPYENGRYSPSPNAKTRAAWVVVQEFCPELTERQCKDIIKTWIDNDVLIIKEHQDIDRHTYPSLFLGKRPGDTWKI